MYPKVFAVKHKDQSVRANSRSGGVFTALTDEVINQNGIVYGCVLNEDFYAEHIRATNFEQRNRMRGSKYIQSKMGNCFSLVKEDLESGLKVLFSGTSCQIAGLKAFLKKDYDNLILVDIVCHGVPSPIIWQKYLGWTAKKYKGSIQKVEFRNKNDFGWAAHVESLWVKRRYFVKQVDSRIFRKLFYNHNVLRPACYKCPYKSTEHPSDITIADYWGIDKAAVGFNDNKGVSLVLINTEKGMQYLDRVKKDIILKQTDIKNSMQNPLIKPEDIPLERQEFWCDFEKMPFGKLAKKYAHYSLDERIKDKAKKFIYGRQNNK